MKNTLLLLIFLGGFIYNSQAQAPEYDDLVTYFADGEYEKLMKKAYKYTQGDKTKRDPLPYYYLSIANYKISQGHELQDKFPKAKKEAIKYAGKCIQKDKEGIVYNNKIAHFTTMKKDIVEEIRNTISDGNLKLLTGLTANINKVDKYDVGVNYLKAVTAYIKENDEKEEKYLKLAEELLANSAEDAFTISEDDSYDITEKKKVDLEMLKIGVIEYANVLVTKNRTSDAKKLIGKIAQWYPEDKEFKAVYDSYFN